MRFQTPLVPARLIRRYKRFLADITLEDGREVTAHCANPGSMLGLAEPGARIWVEGNDDPKKKLKWSWKLVEVAGGGMVCVDTGMANRVVRDALQDGRIAPLADYTEIRPEQKYGAGSRIDFLLRGDGRPDAYVEVKSATLSRRAGLAEFPDSVTIRGTKHLGDIDPAYAAAFAAARQQGVEVLCLTTRITPEGVDMGTEMPFEPSQSGI